VGQLEGKVPLASTIGPPVFNL